MVPRISVAEHAKRKRSAIHQNLHRPKRTRTDHTFAAVLNAALGFMKPEVGNLSWVSHEAIARAGHHVGSELSLIISRPLL